MHISHKMNGAGDRPNTVILGCGNVLLGDDGFGPAVIERLLQHGLPGTVQAIDVGTSVREYLLDCLMAPELRPSHLVVADAAYREGLQPGELLLCRPADLPLCKVHDFSLHQFPTVNLLAELEAETAIEVVLVLAQAATLPEAIAPGLTPVMIRAVETATEMILQRIEQDVTPFSTGTDDAAAECVS
nr:hydrogenase maturation protease [uncultured Desulfobulbus sp.]